MIRLDKELHARGLAKSRSVAAALIADGKVTVNGVVVTKPALAVSDGDCLQVSDYPKYVSRGGYKLGHALAHFGIDVAGKICLDAGASTGGFTDCMLQSGARRVYAVDVGTSQLDARLQGDSRVVSLEQCDIRTATLPEKADFAAADVSFISVKLILPEVRRLIQASAHVIVLVKPQFEYGRKHKGVITDRKVHEKIVADVIAFAEGCGFAVCGVCESPILGKSGNKEFLVDLLVNSE
ncbi:MAG: TlyA family RNA methyltransferase [Oscillospiraceae bacterium]|nr:TlyA family RNA methyltransferase [Oscillospiraceae bacterium]